MELLSSALQEAVSKLKAQERATAARADASERLSGEIISSLTAGLLVVGLNAEIRILNPAGRRLLGVTENPGLEDYRRVLAEPLAQMIDECLATRVPILRRTIRLTAAGATHLGVTVSPLFDDRGELHGAICLFSDLTAVKDLEEQLRLKESLATVGELTAGIAHEFRNGLATIHGYGKLIDLDALPAAFRPYVEGIRAETVSLIAGRHQLPELRPPGGAHAVAGRPARGVRTGGRRDPRRRAGAWRRCRRARSVWSARGRRGAVEAGVLEPAPQRRRGVRRRVRGARHRGRVGAVPGAEDFAHLGATTAAPAWRRRAQDRIFRPFFTSKRTGTGLGLALVQKIIVFHNGRISVGTSPQGGASFQVTLPLGD